MDFESLARASAVDRPAAQRDRVTEYTIAQRGSKFPTGHGPKWLTTTHSQCSAQHLPRFGLLDLRVIFLFRKDEFLEANKVAVDRSEVPIAATYTQFYL